MGSSFDWKNRTAIISGGSSGLGLALARSLAKQGANLVIIGRDPDRLKAVEKQLLDLGATSVLPLSLDVRNLSHN
ncbi:MAG: SDR family NAD(P)-dependent oxidoreductase, partial [Pirellula sp.]